MLFRSADSISSIAHFYAAIAEATAAADTITTNAAMFASIYEYVSGSDSIVGAYLWNIIDDSETANWSAITTNTSAGWSIIDDSGNASWTDIST